MRQGWAVAAVLTGLWGKSVAKAEGTPGVQVAGAEEGLAEGRSTGEWPWAAVDDFRDEIISSTGLAQVCRWHGLCHWLQQPLCVMVATDTLSTAAEPSSGWVLSHSLSTELLCVCCGTAAVWSPLLFRARHCWQRGTGLQFSVTVTLY